MMTVAISLMIFVSSCLLSEEPTELVLGGPRKVVASIESSNGSYVITVRMRPVRSFDATTNRKLNQQKAGLMARRALLAHLKGGGAKQMGTIEVGHTEILSSSLKADLFEQTVRFPKANVVVGAPERTPTTKPKERKNQAGIFANVSADNFLTRKQDYLDTLLALSDSSVEELLGLRAHGPSPSESDLFYSRIADIEEVQVARLASLRQEVMADRLLLTLEQAEILAEVNRKEAEILHDLSEILKSWEKNVKQPDKGNEE